MQVSKKAVEQAEAVVMSHFNFSWTRGSFSGYLQARISYPMADIDLFFGPNVFGGPGDGQWEARAVMTSSSGSIDRLYQSLFQQSALDSGNHSDDTPVRAVEKALASMDALLAEWEANWGISHDNLQNDFSQMRSKLQRIAAGS